MAGGWGDWGTAEAQVRLEAKVAMVSEQEISASRAPTHLGAQLGGTATLPRRVVVRQEYREAIRGPGRQKQQDEVAGCGAAWAATAPTPGRNEAGPRLAQARCQDGAGPHAEKTQAAPAPGDSPPRTHRPDPLTP